MTRPLASIIIPTYNRSELLTEALGSALSQTYSDLEIIVVDDGSTDDTPQVLCRYRDRIRVVHQENRGLPAARNVGLQVSHGDFITFLDSDDLLTPTKIQSQAEYLLAHPHVGVVYGDGYILGEGGLRSSLAPYHSACQPSSSNDFARSLLFQNRFVVHAALARRSVLPDQPAFDESLARFEDWDFWLRTCLAGAAFAFLDEKTILYRRHSGNFDEANVTAYGDAAARIILRVVRRDLDSQLGGGIRCDVRLYHTDLLVEYGTWRDVSRIIRDIVWADGQFSFRAFRMLLLGCGPCPPGGSNWARSLPIVLARRWVGRGEWQLLRSLRNCINQSRMPMRRSLP